MLLHLPPKTLLHHSTINVKTVDYFTMQVFHMCRVALKSHTLLQLKWNLQGLTLHEASLEIKQIPNDLAPSVESKQAKHDNAH